MLIIGDGLYGKFAATFNYLAFRNLVSEHSQYFPMYFSQNVRPALLSFSLPQTAHLFSARTQKAACVGWKPVARASVPSLVNTFQVVIVSSLPGGQARGGRSNSCLGQSYRGGFCLAHRSRSRPRRGFAAISLLPRQRSLPSRKPIALLQCGGLALRSKRAIPSSPGTLVELLQTS